MKKLPATIRFPVVVLNSLILIVLLLMIDTAWGQNQTSTPPATRPPISSTALMQGLNGTLTATRIIPSLTPTATLQRWYIVTDGRDARVRGCPSVDCEVITLLQNGSEVEVLEASEDWLTVLIEKDQKGFIARLLSTTNTPHPVTLTFVEQQHLTRIAPTPTDVQLFPPATSGPVFYPLPTSTPCVLPTVPPGVVPTQPPCAIPSPSPSLPPGVTASPPSTPAP